jgi:hypothetical protein
MDVLDTISTVKQHGGTICTDGQGRLVVDFGDAEVPTSLLDALRANADALKRLYRQTEPTAPAAQTGPQTAPQARADAVTVAGVAVPFAFWEAGQTLTGSVVAIDTETELVNLDDPAAPAPRLVIATATDGQAGFYLASDQLAPFLRDHGGAKFVFHNVVFDSFAIERAIADAGSDFDFWTLVDANRIACTLEFERLLSLALEGSPERYPSLASLAGKYLAADIEKSLVDADGDDVRTSFGKYLGKPITAIPPLALAYAAGDTVATWLVWQRQQEILNVVRASARLAYGYPGEDQLEEAWRTYGPLTLFVQVKAALACRVMTRNGVGTDVDRREIILKELARLEANAAAQLNAAGIATPEPGSKQASKAPAVQTAMLRYLADLEPKLLAEGVLSAPFKRTASNRICADKEQRADWVAQGLDQTITAFAEWSQAKKFAATYADKLTGQLIHPRWNHLLKSGRTSCTGALAMQTLPKDSATKATGQFTIRQCIVPPPGHLFVAVDYGQLELVTLATAMEHQTKFGNALANVIRDGKDVHTAIAGILFGDRIGPVSSEERKSVKPISFGRPGSMGAPSIQRMAKNAYGVTLTLEQVEEVIAAYHRLAPELDQHLAKTNCPGVKASQFLGLRGKWEGWRVLNLLKGSSMDRDGNGLPDQEVERLWSLAQRFKEIMPGNAKTRAQRIKALDDHTPSADLAKHVRNALTAETSISMTGRVRAGCSFPAARNNLFQSIAADGGLLSLWKLFRMGYRISGFIHDEILVAVPDDGNHHDHARTIGEVMQSTMSDLLHGMPVGVEAFVSRSFSKKDAVPKELPPPQPAPPAAPSGAAVDDELPPSDFFCRATDKASKPPEPTEPMPPYYGFAPIQKAPPAQLPKEREPRARRTAKPDDFDPGELPF